MAEWAEDPLLQSTTLLISQPAATHLHIPGIIALNPCLNYMSANYYNSKLDSVMYTLKIMVSEDHYQAPNIIMSVTAHAIS